MQRISTISIDTSEHENSIASDLESINYSLSNSVGGSCKKKEKRSPQKVTTAFLSSINSSVTKSARYLFIINFIAVKNPFQSLLIFLSFLFFCWWYCKFNKSSLPTLTCVFRILTVNCKLYF